MAIRTITTYIAECDCKGCDKYAEVQKGLLPEAWISTSSGDDNRHGVYLKDGKNRPMLDLSGGMMFCSIECFCDYLNVRLGEYRERVKLIDKN